MELSYPKEINLDWIKEHFLKNWFKDIWKTFLYQNLFLF